MRSQPSLCYSLRSLETELTKRVHSKPMLEWTREKSRFSRDFKTRDFDLKIEDLEAQKSRGLEKSRNLEFRAELEIRTRFLLEIRQGSALSRISWISPGNSEGPGQKSCPEHCFKAVPGALKEYSRALFWKTIAPMEVSSWSGLFRAANRGHSKNIPGQKLHGTLKCVIVPEPHKNLDNMPETWSNPQTTHPRILKTWMTSTVSRNYLETMLYASRILVIQLLPRRGWDRAGLPWKTKDLPQS